MTFNVTQLSTHALNLDILTTLNSISFPCQLVLDLSTSQKSTSNDMIAEQNNKIHKS